MSELVVTSKSNREEGSVCQAKCECSDLWSWAQEFAYLRLSIQKNGPRMPNLEWVLRMDLVGRAKIIAATYARFYLELEDHGDRKKKGRYYWMALGAFASKTVACVLGSLSLRANSTLLSRTVEKGLGKGNFWLFQDIAPWHWMYSVSPDDFFGCIEQRNVPVGLRDKPQQAVKCLPDNAEVLPVINNLKASEFVRNGFSLVRQIENEKRNESRRSLQLKHLLEIAQHEQGVVLQPLIYDDPDFARWTAAQRYPVIKQLSPTLELVFTHACETDDPELKSVASDDTVVENYASRMKWIQDAAKQFHYLMKFRKEFMDNELGVIAGWANE